MYNWPALIAGLQTVVLLIYERIIATTLVHYDVVSPLCGHPCLRNAQEATFVHVPDLVAM
jgi:hypothetical protein